MILSRLRARQCLLEKRSPGPRHRPNSFDRHQGACPGRSTPRQWCSLPFSFKHVISRWSYLSHVYETYLQIHTRRLTKKTTIIMDRKAGAWALVVWCSRAGALREQAYGTKDALSFVRNEPKTGASPSVCHAEGGLKALKISHDGIRVVRRDGTKAT